MSDSIFDHAIRLGYSGKLLEPMDRLGPFTEPGEELPPVPAAKWKRFQRELNARINALKRHYDVKGDEPEDLMTLVLSLASDWVPGFWMKDSPLLPKKRGRPVDPMQRIYNLELLVGIEKLRVEKPARTLGMLCKLFHSKNTNHPRWGESKPEALANEYRRLVKIAGKKLVSEIRTSIENGDDVDGTISDLRSEHKRQQRLWRDLMIEAGFRLED